jgi:hypothetical protein
LYRQSRDESLPPPPVERISFFFWRLNVPWWFARKMTHSLGLDVLYGFITIYGMIKLILGLFFGG